MKEKTMKIRKAMLRLMIALMLGIFAGAAPGAALVSRADTVVASEANLPAEGTSDDFSVTFLIWFFGGITLLILFVVVVVVCSSISAVGVFDAQGEE
ncbi:sulfate transporter [Clostridium sp. WB02_MRS01]|uniref:sulfate transporter n=1 Tax=Clostridium sp. WB02_MRS01 TaxID=2605777 RepID=UPI0012B1AFBD|nr:sulfate transporter [Clostridium sp. WB02_MRS01]MSS09118.1 sulfate transporter [Clostridium sp. WB02_MRS01]